ncbi:MAG TPA: DUF4124 domain-containing protein [Nitrospirota bacterium]|nr:DUF4124 domain-containing protein [Nitrospirota bacterium]
MRRYATFAVCVFLIAATPAFAEVYRWVDKDGKENYTNNPEKVPFEYRGSVTKLTPDTSRVIVENKISSSRLERATSDDRLDKYGRGEKYWRKKAASLRLKLRDQQDDYNMVLRHLEDADQKPNVLTSKKKSRFSLENIHSAISNCALMKNMISCIHETIDHYRCINHCSWITG